MIECCRSIQARTRPWRLLGLALIAILLGHDALMALEGVAAPHGPSVEAEYGMADPEAMMAFPEAEYLAAGAEHPEECGVGFSAVLRRGDDSIGGQLLLAPRGLALLHSPSSPRRSIIVPWIEPNWPPGTLRALTQVYRI